MNKELMLKLVEEKLDGLMNEVDELMQLQKELMVEQPEFIVPSQDYSFNLEDTLESVNEDAHSSIIMTSVAIGLMRRWLLMDIL